MNDLLKPGLKGDASFIVKPEHLATVMGSGAVEVLSTAMLVAGLENAAASTVESLLPPELTTVGIHLDISHQAATPIGMKVSFQAVLEEVSSNGKILTFLVRAWDEIEPVSSGTHKRAIVNKKLFEEKTHAKLTGPRLPQK